jgi:hypothetical protein
MALSRRHGCLSRRPSVVPAAFSVPILCVLVALVHLCTGQPPPSAPPAPAPPAPRTSDFIAEQALSVIPFVCQDPVTCLNQKPSFVTVSEAFEVQNFEYVWPPGRQSRVCRLLNHSIKCPSRMYSPAKMSLLCLLRDL